MTQPPQTSSEFAIEELRIESKRLQAQGQKMLDTIGLLDMLSQDKDRLSINGSFVYGLMVHPDIDCNIIDDSIDKSKFADIVATFVKRDFVRKVATVDTVDFEIIIKGRPKGYWLALEIPFDGDRWNIDCWFQRSGWISGTDDKYIEPLATLNQAQIDAVLLIKQWLIANRLYGKKFQSTDVYDAVLSHNVVSLDDFIKLYSH